ncbi:hypothetical protein PR048_019483, partial [Dryococelus australis]
MPLDGIAFWLTWLAISRSLNMKLLNILTKIDCPYPLLWETLFCDLGSKFIPKYLGPFVISKFLGHNAVLLSVPGGTC